MHYFGIVNSKRYCFNLKGNEPDLFCCCSFKPLILQFDIWTRLKWEAPCTRICLWTGGDAMCLFSYCRNQLFYICLINIGCSLTQSCVKSKLLWGHFNPLHGWFHWLALIEPVSGEKKSSYGQHCSGPKTFILFTGGEPPVIRHCLRQKQSIRRNISTGEGQTVEH